MVKITGAKEQAARLKRLSSTAAIEGIGRALFAGGHILESYAARSITEGSVSGKAHVPSAPGTPPNNDTAVLARNIETTQVGPVVVHVSSNAPYSGAQEFGNSRLPERPFMRPAAAATRKDIVDLVAKAIGHIDSGGTVR